ncbi:MAG TPA: amidohydrolase family protein [Acidimicrobiia bacterium]|nr:amidohydrolase family protein [Acidimicrobiia bacterium]
MTAAGTAVIDSDGHVLEPPDFWSAYVESGFRDRAPQLIRTTSGEQLLGYGEFAIGLDLLALSLSTQHRAPVGSDGWEEESRHKLGASGGWDPVARQEDMDVDGIDIAVLYPTNMLHWIEDTPLFAALCRAYNNWLHDFCAANPSRLVGIAVVPLQDPVLAIRELQRCVDELGFKGVMVRPAPYIGTQKLYHPVYDSFWKECTELDVAIGVHPLPYADMPNATRGLRLDDGQMWTTQGLFLRQAIANAVDMQVALAWFVGGGICERFPSLRVGILEGSGGWACTLLERLDHHFRIYGSEHQRTLPSELFARQCWVSFDPDEIALPFSVGHLGADRILWASDYPHPDAKIPGVVKELRAAIQGLGARDQEQVLGGSARAFYRL